MAKVKTDSTEETVYDASEHGPFTVTHMVGDVPCKRVRNGNSNFVHYVDESGKFHVPNAAHGKAAVSINEHKETKSGQIRLTLEEFTLCCKAIIDPVHHASFANTSAQFLGERKVCFSRLEDGSDVRRIVELPAYFDLAAVRDRVGQRIDADETPVVSEETPPEDAPEGEEAGATD